MVSLVGWFFGFRRILVFVDLLVSLVGFLVFVGFRRILVFRRLLVSLVFGFRWVSLGFGGFCWVSLVFVGFRWFPLVSVGFHWWLIFINIRWFVGFHGFRKISLAFVLFSTYSKIWSRFCCS